MKLIKTTLTESWPTLNGYAMKVLVVGATGKAGKRVVRLLKNSDHAPLAMIRDPAQCSTFDELGVPPVVADLEYPIDHAVRSCDSLIFTTGSGGQFPGKVPAPFPRPRRRRLRARYSGHPFGCGRRPRCAILSCVLQFTRCVL